MDMVRGRALEEAKVALAFDSTKAAALILKVLRSAEANAVNNNNLKKEDLYVSEIFVNGGRMQKWGHPGSKGRFNPMLKRSSHIIVGLSEKEKTKKAENEDKKVSAGKVDKKE